MMAVTEESLIAKWSVFSIATDLNLEDSIWIYFPSELHY